VSRTHATPGRAGSAGPAAGRRRPGAASRIACLAGAVAGTLAVGIAAGPAALAQQAHSQQAQGQASQPGRQLSVVIESVSPQWATPGRKVTVTGMVRNGTTTAQQGLSVQLLSSSSPLSNRTDMAFYAAGRYSPAYPVVPAAPLSRVIPPGGEVSWKLTLQPSAVGMTAFGVYPLAAQVVNGVTGQTVTDRTFLPFWPGHGASPRPRPLSIAWIWPLIDHPYQAACPALFSNALTSRLAPDGRLGRLLAAGASYSAAAHLTWAIDPALVQNAHTMTSRYQVDGFPDCDDATSLPPSPAAQTWLRQLSQAVGGQQVFLTPYADADVAALSHVGLDADLKRAFADRQIGQHILHLPAAGDIAWPASGLADSSVLGNLAVSGIGTVVLDATVMPPSGPQPNYTPSAQASVASSIGTRLNVLLADHAITQMLRSAGSARTGASFATQQRFLAETAMIVAESPQLARSLVVAPPRRWNPAPGLPGDLLSDTVRAPWLKPTSLAALAAVKHPTGQVHRRRPPDRQVSKAELSRSYLAQVSSLDKAVSVQGSILVPPAPDYLGTAVATLESTAWRGDQAGIQQALIRRVARYVAAQSRKVSIIDRGQITLSGSSGKVPISITNRLPGPVQVRLHARVPPDKRLIVESFDNAVSIPPGKTMTIRVPIHASTVGVTYVTLGLLAPDGHPLPGTLVRLSVHATRFGTLALVIVCGALGVFVLTAFARTVRRARRDGRGGGEPRRPAPDPPGPAAVTGSVMSGDDLAHDHPPEDPDEYADARGRASR
jgi:hypothetical protein